MGARIEISLEEYNKIRKDKTSLQNEVIDKDKEITFLKQKIEHLEELFEDITSLTFLERLFYWKQYIKLLKKDKDEQTTDNR